MGTEIEAKYYVPDLESVRNQLVEWGAEISHPRVHERNQLFLSPYQDFKAERIILRLRQDTETKITYKSPLTSPDENIRVRRELETIVGDYETMHAILTALGYYPELFYEKYRTVYTLPDYPNIEIMLDELPYGDFIEVEGELEDIKTILVRLELPDNQQIHTNYAGIFWAVKKAQNLTIEHIRFADFADITVDTAIFATL